MSDLIEKYAAAAENAIPPEQQTKRLARAAQELATLNRDIETMEASLKTLKEQRHEIRTKTMPDLMNEVGVDIIGVPEMGVDVVLKDQCHASIKKDWDDDRKLRAFEHLREIGGEDLIKVQLSVFGDRGSDDKMRMLYERVRQIMAELELSAGVHMEPSVAWNSLTAFVKSVMKDGETVVDLETIGATYGSVVDVVKKKEK